MFGKKTQHKLHDEIIHKKNEGCKISIEKKTEVQEALITDDKKNTVISHDVVFEGNIKSNQSIYIYGKVIGDIFAEKNTVNIMLDGEVAGNITSQSLIINGKVNGECQSEDLKIESNGEVDGIIKYTTIEIKKGGRFIGNSEPYKNTSRTNSNKTNENITPKI